MSAKTSSPLHAASSASGTSAAGVAGAATNSSPSSVVKIKKELPNVEFKEYAENTMNELLGWYGFDGVDRLELSTKTSRLIQNAAAAAVAANNNNNGSTNSNILSQQQQRHQQHRQQQQQQDQQQHHHAMQKRRSRSRAASLLSVQQQNEHNRNFANNNNNTNNTNKNNNNNNNTTFNNNNRKSAINCNNYRLGSSSRSAIANLIGSNESTTSDHDTRSSREEDSKSPLSSAGGKTVMDEKIDYLNCCWCRRPIPENAPEFLTTSDGPRYCSESCFTQSRRASFKKAKTCDWCKHVRHAVSYVDFQDGASQLQFCSDKCLNQYKMQIFCKETQAHLDMNPHLRDQGLEAAAAGNGANLITPDLWLRNCRSRSASPASTISVSPGPLVVTTLPITPPRMTPPSITSSNSGGHIVSTAGCATPSAVHKPLISVAPVSKLMNKNTNNLTTRPSPKQNRKKRPLRSTTLNDLNSGGLKNAQSGMPGNSSSILGKSSKCSLTPPNQRENVRTSPRHHMSGGPSGRSTAASLASQFAGSSVQDLHIVPPLSPMLDQQPHGMQLPPPSLTPHGHGMSNNAGRPTSIPPAYFATTPSATQQQPSHLPPAGFGPRSHFMPNPLPPHGMLPRFMNNFHGMQQPPLPPPLLPTSDLSSLGFLGTAPPPVTVMVPYPIIIPLPIPIPVPLPIIDFYKAHLTPAERARFEEERSERREQKHSETLKNNNSNNNSNQEEQQTTQESTSADEGLLVIDEVKSAIDEPLDFTKSHIEHELESDQKSKFSSNVASPDGNTNTTATTTTTATTPTPLTITEDSSSSIQTTHCIMRAESFTESKLSDANTKSNPKDGEETTADKTSHKLSHEDNSVDNTTEDGREKLPKFKITRLQTKRTLIQTKETAAECSRPLRKRKRIIDCDFQKIALKDAEREEGLIVEQANITADENLKADVDGEGKK